MDLFRKWKSLYSATANSFGTGEGVTITPSSVVGLPTDTEITLTFDREVPGKIERIRGVVSGGNFIVASGGRGADGTTEQAHTSPVIEHIPNGSDINDLVDGILKDHNQDGSHNIIIDEDDMASDSDTKVPTQQSVKAYVDSSSSGAYQFIFPGSAVVSSDVAGTWFTPAGTIKSISLFAGTAGATGDTIVDVNKNGTTIFTTQANRPKLNNTDTSSTGNIPDIKSISEGDKITIDVDSVTTTPQVDLYVVIKYGG